MRLTCAQDPQRGQGVVDVFARRGQRHFLRRLSLGLADEANALGGAVPDETLVAAITDALLAEEDEPPFARQLVNALAAHLTHHLVFADRGVEHRQLARDEDRPTVAFGYFGAREHRAGLLSEHVEAEPLVADFQKLRDQLVAAGNGRGRGGGSRGPGRQGDKRREAKDKRTGKQNATASHGGRAGSHGDGVSGWGVVATGAQQGMRDERPSTLAGGPFIRALYGVVS